MLQAEKAALEAGPQPPPAVKTSSAKDALLPAGSEAATAQLRLELAEALRSQGQLQSRLKAAEEELVSLRARTKSDGRAIRALNSERNALATRVRDRDEELRGKSKLVEVRTAPVLPAPRPVADATSRTCRTSSSPSPSSSTWQSSRGPRSGPRTRSS